MVRSSFRATAGFLLAAIAALPAHSGEKPKFKVKITDEKAVVVDMDDSTAIDPVRRINFNDQQFQGGFYLNIRTSNNQTLHLSHFPMFLINGQQMQPGQGGRFEAGSRQLGKTPGGRVRDGYRSTWVLDNLRITQTVELHPAKAKAPGQKRLMNTVLISYTIENKGNAVQKVGARVCMDTYVIDNDGCLFAAPTHPKKVLDGVILENKTLPPYVQMLQRPNVENPGYVSHLTLDVGSRYEKINKVVLSSLRAGFGQWDMQAQAAMGDSALSAYWPTKDIKPGGKRELAYAYGEGIGSSTGSEGRNQISFSGSFEPGKAFTIAAVVADPAPGQTLTLELSRGMKRLEGKEVQSVPPLADDQEYSTVLWKARVLEPGEHVVRIRSSTGVTETKIVTVTLDK
jgi:hypothetical protein